MKVTKQGTFFFAHPLYKYCVEQKYYNNCLLSFAPRTNQIAAYIEISALYVLIEKIHQSNFKFSRKQQSGFGRARRFHISYLHMYRYYLWIHYYNTAELPRSPVNKTEYVMQFDKNAGTFSTMKRLTVKMGNQARDPEI